jgi:hypothetical protein
MPRRRKLPPTDTSPPAERGQARGPRVLIVAPDQRAASRMEKRGLQAFPAATFQHAATSAAATRAIADDAPQLALIHAHAAGAFSIAEDLAASSAGCCAAIILSEEPTLGEALRAMRAGVREVVSTRAAADELGAAMGRALAQTGLARRREDHIRRLGRLCHHLNRARREVTGQVSSLCSDMVNAFQEMADKVCEITTASEFGGIIRQELDVESVLRTALEYVLAKCGSTNAAVFLPSDSQDFTLGAYVNYDCPKDALDMMLEHLVGIVAPRVQDEEGITILTDEHQLADFFGDDAHWLADCTATAFSCRHKGECLAVVLLFRDRRTPFSESALETLRIISGVFGHQLARIVRVHHRHLPKSQDTWGLGFADEGDDDLDLAA